MPDRLGDLLARAADDDLEGVSLELPEAAPQRRRWTAPALAAAAVLALVVGSVLVLGERSDRVDSVDPAAPPTESSAVPVDPADMLASALERTMSEPWTATVQIGANPLDSLQFQPPDRYRFDELDAVTATVWIQDRAFSVAVGPPGAIAVNPPTELEDPNPFDQLLGALGNPVAVRAEGDRSLRVEVSSGACLGAGRQVEPADPATCSVLVEVSGGRLSVVEISNDQLDLPESVRLEIGPADPSVVIEDPQDVLGATTTSTP